MKKTHSPPSGSYVYVINKARVINVSEFIHNLVYFINSVEFILWFLLYNSDFENINFQRKSRRPFVVTYRKWNLKPSRSTLFNQDSIHRLNPKHSINTNVCLLKLTNIFFYLIQYLNFTLYIRLYLKKNTSRSLHSFC